jgi:hypothetical protein
VSVDDGVADGDADALGDDDALGELDGLGDEDGLGEEDALGDEDGVGHPEGPGVVHVLYIPFDAAVTKMDMSLASVPVPPAPLKQLATHSSVPGADALTPATLSRSPTLPSSSPLNGDVTPVTTFDTELTKVPPSVYS